MTNETGELRDRMAKIKGGVVTNAPSGRGRRVTTSVLALTAAMAIGGGGFWLIGMQSSEPDVTAVSGVTDFADDNTRLADLSVPIRPEPIVQTVVDSAALARLKELEAELAQAHAREAANSEETERERELRQALQKERDGFANDIAALRSAAQNDQNRAREEAQILANRVSNLEASLGQERAEWSREELRLTTDNEKALAERDRMHGIALTELRQNLQQQLNDARLIDPLEQERLRLETLALENRKRLAEERKRAEAEWRARQEARATSKMIAVGKEGNGAPEPGQRRSLSANEAFVSNRDLGVTTSVATTLYEPERLVPQGTVIQASLETAIDSSLPGQIRAVIAEDVFSFDGSQILIPAGSKVFGSYKSGIELGQKRILVAWTRIVTPDNLSVQIASYGADQLGRSGTSGAVDTRFGTKFAGAAAISIIGAAPALLAGNTSSESAALALETVGDDLSTTASSAIGQFLTIPPTIYVKQGSAITIILDRDVIF